MQMQMLVISSYVHLSNCSRAIQLSKSVCLLVRHKLVYLQRIQNIFPTHVSVGAITTTTTTTTETTTTTTLGVGSTVSVAVWR